MDITDQKYCFSGESGLSATTLSKNNDHSAVLVMRSPVKKQGSSTPSADNRKYKSSKATQKKCEKDLKRNDTIDRSPSYSPNAGILRRCRVSRDSNDGGSPRPRSTSSGKSRGRSSSATKASDKQYTSPSSREKKPKKDAGGTAKRGRSNSKSPKKVKPKASSSSTLTKDLEADEEREKSAAAKSKTKRGRPPKASYAKDNIATTIERVIAKYTSFMSSSNAKKSDKSIVSPKKLCDIAKAPCKKMRMSSSTEDKSPEVNSAKKKRGRPVGSKNRKKSPNEKVGGGGGKKSICDHSKAGRHLSESSYEEDSPPFKKQKLSAKDDESKAKAKLKPKKLSSGGKKNKERNSTSIKKRIVISKVKSGIVKKMAKKVTTGLKRGVGRPRKNQNKIPSKVVRKNQKLRDSVDSSEDTADTHKHKTWTKLKSRSPSRESEKITKDKLILPIKKKYKREYFSESENTSGREDDEIHMAAIIKNPKKAFRDKWKRELKEKSKAEKIKLKEKLVNQKTEKDKLPQRREHKPRAVTFDFGKTYDFTDSEDEADKDTDSDREIKSQKCLQRKRKEGSKKKKKVHAQVAPVRRTARMASLNAIAMMHCMNEDAKVSFSSSHHTKDELAVVPVKESTIARRHSDSDSDDTDSESNHHRDKPGRGRPRKKSKEKIAAKPPKKRKRRRNELGVTMDIREMVVQKRMASLNASAIMAACYSLESRNKRVPTSYSSENEATDFDIKQKVSYKATKEASVKTRSIITVQETSKKMKKAQGRKETQVEERIIFKKKVKRHTALDSTDTDKEDNATDVSENDSEVLPKTPDSGLMIESTITYVTTQTVTMPKPPVSASNKYSSSSANNKTDMVQHVSQKSTSSTVSLPHIQPTPHPVHSGGQAIGSSNQHSFSPAQKYSPLGALSEMHPILHPHLPHPHQHPLPFQPQHILPPPQQHPAVAPYHHLASHPIIPPPQVAPHHPVASVTHHALPYPPLSPHSPPYPPPPPPVASNSPVASSSPSSTPNSYCSSPYSSSVSQSSPSAGSPKSSASLIVPLSPSHKQPSKEDHRQQATSNRSQGALTSSCERHHSAFTAPTPSALSPVSTAHGYQPVSGPMPTGNVTVSSTYKSPPQQGPPISAYSPSSTTSPRIAKPPYKTDYHAAPNPPYPPYHGHPYPYDKYGGRAAPYQFYQQHYPPPNVQFGAPPGEYGYPAVAPGAMHCSQEYAYTLCIPGPANHPASQSSHQPLALPPPTSAASSATPNTLPPQYYQYPEYPPVFAYPSAGTIVRINVLGPAGQNAICYPPSKYRPPGPPIGGGKGPDGENAWPTSPPPYNYQYYNPPNNHSIHPYQQHPSIHDTNQCSKPIVPKNKSSRDCPSQRERNDDSLEVIDKIDSASSQIGALSGVANVSKPMAITSQTADDSKPNGVSGSSNSEGHGSNVSTPEIRLPTSSCLGSSGSTRSVVDHAAPVKELTDKVADSTKLGIEKRDNSEINHIVPLCSASSNAVVVPATVQQSICGDETSQNTPRLCPVSQPNDDTGKSITNSLGKPNCSDINVTDAISLSSSETPKCNRGKSSSKPLFITSAQTKNCAKQNDICSTNGDACLTNSDASGCSSSQSDKSVSPGLEPRKSADQRSGMRHLLCQSQPLSHSKSTSVLVKAKPSNFMSVKSAAGAGNKKDSLDNSNNFTSTSSPKNFYARSSEISAELTAEKKSSGKKEGRNLTQPRKRGRPPKVKTMPQVTAGKEVPSSGNASLPFATSERQGGGSSRATILQAFCSVDQNLNAVSSDSVLIKGAGNNVLKIESVKVEGVAKKHAGEMGDSIAMKSLNGFNKVENLADCDSKQNFTPISNEQLLQRMSNMKREDNLPMPAEEGIKDLQIMEAVQKLSGDNFLSKQRKFRKTGKVGRPSTKKATADKVRRKNVSLLSYLKDKNNESDAEESRAVNEAEDGALEKDSPKMKHPIMPFAPMPAQLQRKRRSSGLMKNKMAKKPKYSHGWSWQGEPNDGKVWLRNDENLFPRKCYTAMKHKLGDCLRVRDCVLLRSGTRRTDLPYVAKIAAFWEDPDTSDMMMSILWYYRPEHTDYGRRSDDLTDEIFASKHRDHLSVACIDDRCYVLTYNEYCRYRRQLRLFQMRVSASSSPVPQGDEEYLRLKRQPNGCVVQDLLFFCKRVYDYRQKRFLKNPI